MSKEIERKYLVEGDGWRTLAARSRLLRQGYVATTATCTVRVRVVDNEAYLTIKGRRDHDSRDEYEYRIPLREAEEMLTRLCAGSLIEKRRHDVPYGDWLIEVDEFQGANEGLVLAEIEAREGMAWPEDFPSWFGSEVTADDRFYNSYLGRHPYSDWAGHRQ